MDQSSKESTSSGSNESKPPQVYVFDQNPRIECTDQFHRPFTFFEHIQRTPHEDLEPKSSGSSVTFATASTPSQSFFYPYQCDNTGQPNRMDVSKGFYRRDHKTDKRVLWEKYRRRVLWNKLIERTRYNQALLPEILGKKSGESLTYTEEDLNRICLPRFEGSERKLHLQSLPDISKYVRGIKPNKKFKRETVKTGFWPNTEEFENSEGEIWKFQGDEVIKESEKKKFEQDSFDETLSRKNKSISSQRPEGRTLQSKSISRSVDQSMDLRSDSIKSQQPKDRRVSTVSFLDQLVKPEEANAKVDDKSKDSGSAKMTNSSASDTDDSSSTDLSSTPSRTSDTSGSTDFPLFVKQYFEDTSLSSIDYFIKNPNTQTTKNFINMFLEDYIEKCPEDEFNEIKSKITAAMDVGDDSDTTVPEAISSAVKLSMDREHKKLIKGQKKDSIYEHDCPPDAPENADKLAKKCVKTAVGLPDEETIDGSNLSYLEEPVVEYPHPITIKDIKKKILVDEGKLPDFESRLPPQIPISKRQLISYKRKHAVKTPKAMKYRLKITHQLVPEVFSGRVFTHKKPLFTLDLEDIIVQSAYRPINQYTGQIVTRLQLPVEKMKNIDDKSSETTVSGDEDKGEENYVMKLKKEVQRREMQRAEMRLSPQYTTNYLGPKMGTSFLPRQQINRIKKEYTTPERNTGKKCFSRNLTLAMRENKFKFRKEVVGSCDYMDDVDDTLEFFTLPPLFHINYEFDPDARWTETNATKTSSEMSADFDFFHPPMEDERKGSPATIKSSGGVSFSNKTTVIYPSPNHHSSVPSIIKTLDLPEPSDTEKFKSQSFGSSPLMVSEGVLNSPAVKKHIMTPQGWQKCKKELKRLLKFKIERSKSITKEKKVPVKKEPFDIKKVLKESKYQFPLNIALEMEKEIENVHTETIYDSDENVHTFYPFETKNDTKRPGVVDIDYLALMFEEREISVESFSIDEDEFSDNDVNWNIRSFQQEEIVSQIMQETSEITEEKEDFIMICDCEDALKFGVESMGSESDKSVSLMFKMFVRENPGKGYEEVFSTCKSNIFKVLEGRFKSAGDLDQFSFMMEKKDSDDLLIKAEHDDDNDSDESNISVDLKKNLRQRYIDKLRAGTSAMELAKKQIESEDRIKRDLARLAAKTAIQKIGQPGEESDAATIASAKGSVSASSAPQMGSMYSFNIGNFDDLASTHDVEEKKEVVEDEEQAKVSVSSLSLTSVGSKAAKFPVKDIMKKRFPRTTTPLSQFLVKTEMTPMNRMRYRAILSRPPKFLNPWNRSTRAVKYFPLKEKENVGIKGLSTKDSLADVEIKAASKSVFSRKGVSKKTLESNQMFPWNVGAESKNAFSKRDLMPQFDGEAATSERSLLSKNEESQQYIEEASESQPSLSRMFKSKQSLDESMSGDESASKTSLSKKGDSKKNLGSSMIKESTASLSKSKQTIKDLPSSAEEESAGMSTSSKMGQSKQNLDVYTSSAEEEYASTSKSSLSKKGPSKQILDASIKDFPSSAEEESASTSKSSISKKGPSKQTLDASIKDLSSAEEESAGPSKISLSKKEPSKQNVDASIKDFPSSVEEESASTSKSSLSKKGPSNLNLDSSKKFPSSVDVETAKTSMGAFPKKADSKLLRKPLQRYPSSIEDESTSASKSTLSKKIGSEQTLSTSDYPSSTEEEGVSASKASLSKKNGSKQKLNSSVKNVSSSGAEESSKSSLPKKEESKKNVDASVQKFSSSVAEESANASKSSLSKKGPSKQNLDPSIKGFQSSVEEESTSVSKSSLSKRGPSKKNLDPSVKGFSSSAEEESASASKSSLTKKGQSKQMLDASVNEFPSSAEEESAGASKISLSKKGQSKQTLDTSLKDFPSSVEEESANASKSWLSKKGESKQNLDSSAMKFPAAEESAGASKNSLSKKEASKEISLGYNGATSSKSFFSKKDESKLDSVNDFSPFDAEGETSKNVFSKQDFSKQTFDKSKKPYLKKSFFGNVKVPPSTLTEKGGKNPKYFNLRWHYFPVMQAKRLEAYERGPIADKLRKSFDAELLYSTVKTLEMNENEITENLLKESSKIDPEDDSDASCSEIQVQEVKMPTQSSLPQKCVLEMDPEDTQVIEAYLKELHKSVSSVPPVLQRTPTVWTYEASDMPKLSVRQSRSYPVFSAFFEKRILERAFRFNECLRCYVAKFSDVRNAVVSLLTSERKKPLIVQKCAHDPENDSIFYSSFGDIQNDAKKKNNAAYNMDWIYSKKMRFPTLSSLYKIQDKQLFCVKNPYQEPFLHKIKELHLGMKIGRYLRRTHGIESHEIIPPEMILTYKFEKSIFMYPGIHFLPLEIFDNTSFDIRNSEEWLDMGWSREDHCFGVPAIAFIPSGNYQLYKERYVHHFWTDVVVYDYDPSTECFAVFPCSASHGPYLIKRIYICFLGENPIVHCDRIASAVSLRNHAEYKLRYRFFKDCVDIKIYERYEEMSPRLKQILKDTAKQHPNQKEIAQQLMLRWEDMFRKVVISKLVDKFVMTGKGKEIFYLPMDDPRPFHWGKRKTFDCNEDESFKEDISESESDFIEDESEEEGTNPSPFLVHKKGENLPTCPCKKDLIKEREQSIAQRITLHGDIQEDPRKVALREHERICGLKNGLFQNKNCYCFVDPKFHPKPRLGFGPPVKWATKSTLLSFVLRSHTNTVYEKLYPGPQDQKTGVAATKVKRRGRTIVIKPKKISQVKENIFKQIGSTIFPMLDDDTDPIDYWNLARRLDDINNEIYLADRLRENPNYKIPTDTDSIKSPHESKYSGSKKSILRTHSDIDYAVPSEFDPSKRNSVPSFERFNMCMLQKRKTQDVNKLYKKDKNKQKKKLKTNLKKASTRKVHRSIDALMSSSGSSTQNTEAKIKKIISIDDSHQNFDSLEDEEIRRRSRDKIQQRRSTLGPINNLLQKSGCIAKYSGLVNTYRRRKIRERRQKLNEILSKIEIKPEIKIVLNPDETVKSVLRSASEILDRKTKPVTKQKIESDDSQGFKEWFKKTDKEFAELKRIQSSKLLTLIKQNQERKKKLNSDSSIMLPSVASTEFKSQLATSEETLVFGEPRRNDLPLPSILEEQPLPIKKQENTLIKANYESDHEEMSTKTTLSVEFLSQLDSSKLSSLVESESESIVGDYKDFIGKNLLEMLQCAKSKMKSLEKPRVEKSQKKVQKVTEKYQKARKKIEKNSESTETELDQDIREKKKILEKSESDSFREDKSASVQKERETVTEKDFLDFFSIDLLDKIAIISKDKHKPGTPAYKLIEKMKSTLGSPTKNVPDKKEWEANDQDGVSDTVKFEHLLYPERTNYGKNRYKQVFGNQVQHQNGQTTKHSFVQEDDAGPRRRYTYEIPYENQFEGYKYSRENKRHGYKQKPRTQAYTLMTVITTAKKVDVKGCNCITVCNCTKEITSGFSVYGADRSKSKFEEVVLSPEPPPRKHKIGTKIFEVASPDFFGPQMPKHSKTPSEDKKKKIQEAKKTVPEKEKKSKKKNHKKSMKHHEALKPEWVCQKSKEDLPLTAHPRSMRMSQIFNLKELMTSDVILQDEDTGLSFKDKTMETKRKKHLKEEPIQWSLPVQAGSSSSDIIDLDKYSSGDELYEIKSESLISKSADDVSEPREKSRLSSVEGTSTHYSVGAVPENHDGVKKEKKKPKENQKKERISDFVGDTALLAKKALRPRKFKLPFDKCSCICPQCILHRHEDCDAMIEWGLASDLMGKELSERRFLEFPLCTCEKYVQSVDSGDVDTTPINVRRARNALKRKLLLTKPEIFNIFVSTVKLCEDLTKKTFFDMSKLTLSTLDAVCENLNRQRIELAYYINGLFRDTIKVNYIVKFQNNSKGYYSLKENDWDVYNISNTSKFLRMIRYLIETSLRILLLRSLSDLENYIVKSGRLALAMGDDYEWKYEIRSRLFDEARHNYPSLFILDLKIGPEGPYYTNSIDSHIEKLHTLIDKAVLVCHNVPLIDMDVNEQLQYNEFLTYNCYGMGEIEVVQTKFLIEYVLKKVGTVLEGFRKRWEIYSDFTALDSASYISNLMEKCNFSHEIELELIKQKAYLSEYQYIIPEATNIGPFSISTAKIKYYLLEKRSDLIAGIQNAYCGKLRKKTKDVIGKYYEMFQKVLEKTRNIEHLMSQKEWMETIPNYFDEQEEVIAKHLKEYDLFDRFCFSIPEDDVKMKLMVAGWPHKILEAISSQHEVFEDDTAIFHKIQTEDEAAIQDRIEYLSKAIAAVQLQDEKTKVHEIAQEVGKIWKLLRETVEWGRVLNNRQRLFGDKVTPFTELQTLMKTFTPFKNLWATASDWLQTADMFLDNPLVNIDPGTIEGIVNEHAKTMNKCIKLFSEIPACQKIAEMIKELIEEFKPHIPIIQALCAKGMRKRHWEEFQAMTGIPINWTPALTYKECINLGVHECGEALAVIADQAKKEYVIEQAFDKMVAEWENCLASFTPFKDSETFIFKLSDEVFQMLEDHIELTQSLQFSPSKGPFEAMLDEWEKKLLTTQKILEKWVECQQNFMYLYPIFTSPDIASQLVLESKKFANVLRMWRKLMNDFKNNPQVMNACNDHKTHDLIGNCMRAMNVIMAGLNNYLQVKRTFFPRFYFLSDEELVEILSKCSDPQAVQPHLKKLFENIYRLNFNENGIITAMYSGDGEEVKFKNELKPVGSVDNWLWDVEKAMRETIHAKVTGALTAFAQRKVRSDRNSWVLNWPGQVIIVCSQIIWTSNVETCIGKGNLNSYYVTQLGYLDNLRSLIRGDLTKLQRLSVSALIVIDVHARDVTEMLLRKLVNDVHDFDWSRQLRFYYNPNTITLRAINAEFPYGYEYLGNSGRLVITPLTDRCYLTLIGALHLKFGGAPAGPAGTGKTETTKDLAKAFAVQCVVFNCSDQLDFMAMGKFFKGLATCGAWACFDEFNRIDIEVLSVVAQQITTIQRAQMARQETFIFEGEELVLKPSCAVFVTMNPGYAGRTELPDNLKALFRPVAMMVPDYTLIAEISLFSFGFTEARLLAAKITSTFKLSSEQLSTQDHYDFGMRAVKTVIAVAGNMKKEDPTFNETLIVLRALKDVNVPKFLVDDLKLFLGILADLFPNIVDPPIDYGGFQKAIEKVIEVNKLYKSPGFVTKVIQLYDTTVVRHGLMLIGPAGAGKTKCYQVLQETMGSVKGMISHSGGLLQTVHVSVINPKAINMGQIYGEYDPQTHEWSDGVLAKLMREGAAAEDTEKRWYMFDGPVDAVWIENMNTLLDDNKKLCLTSGEIIKMTEAMTMMFEVSDLAVASPATVSRCGMVYLEPTMITLDMLVHCWFKRLPKSVSHISNVLESAIKHYMLPTIKHLRTSMTEIVKSVPCGVMSSALKLLGHFVSPLIPELGKLPPPEKNQVHIRKLAVMWVIWSTIWSIGATCNLNEREKFSVLLNKLINKHDKDLKFPKFFAYDYWINDGGFTMPTQSGLVEVPKWVHWLANVPLYEIPPATRFIDIEVPTIDSIRNAAVLGRLVENNEHVLVVGPTGSGKTVTILSKINRNMPEKFVSDFMTFTARTSLNQTRDTIESKLEKRKKLVIGAPLNKSAILFIDDFNMPAVEKFGAQPPLELIRQFMDFGGWYDTKTVGAFKTVEDVNFVGAMGPPGGGRNKISERLLRHFHILAYPEFNQSTRKIIFGTILNYWMEGIKGFTKVSDKILNMTLKLYNIIEKELLPTPAKMHYTYNLRDLGKVFQGILLAHADDIKTIEEMLILWIHECTRVFSDRLINDTDRQWFKKQIKHEIDEAFQIDYNYLNKHEPILFGDFMNFLEPSNYVHITDFEKLSSAMNSYLQSYNKLSTAPMSLVLFMDAIEHVCRIVRIIKQPQANGLLLGIGGSGRRSLTKLSSFMTDHTCVTVEPTRSYGINEWRDDLKKMMYYSGIHGRETVFLFSDSQIIHESFLEDVNSMLNSGDIPNIYLPEDLDKIYAAMRNSVIDAGLAVTKANLFSLYLKNARTNLHVIFTMSPIGDEFRSRLRQFPALVNCCTIDWFSLWPDSALENVATQYIKTCGYFTKEPQELVEGVVHSCKFIHLSVVNMAELFFEEYGRRTYISPTKYLILLHTYVNLMFKTKTGDEELLVRYHTGLEKLLMTSEEVNELREAIKDMQPVLKESRRRALEVEQRIKADKIEAEKTKEVVAMEEKKAQEAQEETTAHALETEKDLEKAMPALRKAEAALLSINKKDITEVKAMKRPPAPVVLVMEVLCLIKDIPPNKLPGRLPGEKILDYWEPARNMLTDPGVFLKSLIEYDRDSMTEETIKKIEPYIKNPKFTAKNIKAASKACNSLFTWIHAIYDYYFINKTVAPKRAVYDEAKAKLEECQKALERSRNRMKKVLDGLVELEARLAKTQARVKTLEENEQTGIAKLELAEELLSSLDDEKKRWIENASQITKSSATQVGNLLICAATVAYFGPFSDDYRRALQLEWTRTLEAMNVPNDPDVEPVQILSTPMEIRRWQLSGLPKDFSSTENAILCVSSLRFPLFIDPTGQANKWIKGTLRETRLIVQKFGNKELLRELEGAISFGRVILIENIGLEIDPILDPILNKQIFPYRGSDCIKFGENIIPYNERFMIYFTTRLRNPTYSPEICSKINIINFTLSVGGLEDQLLSMVVACKRPDLEEQKSRLVESTAEMKIEIKNLEDRILMLISSASGSPLDDMNLIEALKQSKEKSENIREKFTVASKTAKSIDETRIGYAPVARRAQILYFCLADMSKVDPMYQYSLEWFTNIFTLSLMQTEQSTNSEERNISVNNHFTYSLFTNVCRSLFEKNRLQFTFLICIRMMVEKKQITKEELEFFLTGGKPKKKIAAPEWIPEQRWLDVMSLENLPQFESLIETIKQSPNDWRFLIDDPNPYKAHFPMSYHLKLSVFQRLMLIRFARPDKLIDSILDYISNHIGTKYIEPLQKNVSSLYADSTALTPLLFVLSPGTDPAEDFMNFAEKQGMAKRVMAISLGQGQGPIAEEMFNKAVQTGGWIFYQNCHLAPSWMPKLEQLIESLPFDFVHKDFRVWLTSTPSESFPTSILENGNKMTIEPPRGVKANLLRAYTGHVLEYVDFMNSDDPKAPSFKGLLFSLCLFHAIILERRKFGPLGFNIPYEFTDGDLRISINQLHMFIMEYETVPYKVLSYTAGEINYGGRVTDDWDRRCIRCLLSDYYNPKVLIENYMFDLFAYYYQLPFESPYNNYLSYIKELPINDETTLFGLHTNANITYAQGEAAETIKMLLSLQPQKTGKAAATQEAKAASVAKEILSIVPPPFMELEKIQEKFPIVYEESLNTVLYQEILRYNKLLSIIQETTMDLLKAIDGLVVMSEPLEEMSKSLYLNQVPEMWASKGYPSLMPLGAWSADLKKRIRFLKKWIENGRPANFWISGFFFPQAFLTGILQNYARTHIVSVDAISFSFVFLEELPRDRKADGCVIYGLFLEGARWNQEKYKLSESLRKVLYTEMSPIWLKPDENLIKGLVPVYNCPVYKTLKRVGTLSTTGHSTNYVITIDIPTKKTNAHWVQRGVALFCALDY